MLPPIITTTNDYYYHDYYWSYLDISVLWTRIVVLKNQLMEAMKKRFLNKPFKTLFVENIRNDLFTRLI